MKLLRKVCFNLFAINLVLFNTLCNGQLLFQIPNIDIGKVVTEPIENIGCIYQDNNHNYWFASNSKGVYFFDGKILKNFNTEDCLISNYVLKIEADISGLIWITTRDGICTFDGKNFVNCNEKIKNSFSSKLFLSKDGLFFGRDKDICYFNGNNFSVFSLHPESYFPPEYSMNRPFRVYSTLIDKSGNAWFGTQEKGICRFDGISFTFFTENGLDKAAVRTIFQDKSGTIWAGNNGAGLFRFNGQSFNNFTSERGLSNLEFLINLNSKAGTLARPWTINEDNEGNLWIGTIDTGVWKYDGEKLTNYTVKDGLTGNSIWTIFKNRNSELWFVTEGNKICKFDGNKFYEFIIK